MLDPSSFSDEARMLAVLKAQEGSAMKRQMLIAGLIVLGTTATTTAAAYDRNRHHDRVGGTSYIGGGISELSVNDADFGYDARDDGFKIFAGYEFNELFAAEIGYLDGATIVDVGPFDTEHVDLRAVTAMLVGRVPLTSSVAIFGKFGGARYETDFRWTIDGDVIDKARFRDNELAYGFGLVVGAGGSFEIRGEYEAIENAFDAISLSAMFRFR